MSRLRTRDGNVNIELESAKQDSQFLKFEFELKLTSPLFLLILIIAAFVIVLTALTFFSTQILEAIFGNGMVEVSNNLINIILF